MSENVETIEAVAKPKKKRVSYGITDEQFVDSWESSESAQEAADKLSKAVGQEVPKSLVLARASAYRAKGVNLKKMNKHHYKIDPAKLNERINKSEDAQE